MTMETNLIDMPSRFKIYDHRQLSLITIKGMHRVSKKNKFKGTLWAIVNTTTATPSSVGPAFVEFGQIQM